jgi:hypothetical protein
MKEGSGSSIGLKALMTQLNKAVRTALGSAGSDVKTDSTDVNQYVARATVLVPPRPTCEQVSLNGAGTSLYKNGLPYR